MKVITARFVLSALGLPAVLALGCSPGSSRDLAEERGLLSRDYEAGERLHYRMTGTNQHGARTTSYEATATGVVKQDSAGGFIEEYQWSGLAANGTAFELDSASLAYRQLLSLAPDHKLSLSGLSRVQPALIGPITDLLTIYADVWLAMRQPDLARPGDRAVIEHGEANSWADGTRTVLGEDAIDFEIVLAAIDSSEAAATLIIRHVPPERPAVRIPADWMREPVADVPNNWVQVVHTRDGQYVASVGKETFDVEVRLSMSDGRITSARMDNRVEVFERVCTDEALTACGDGTRYEIVRRIDVSEVP